MSIIHEALKKVQSNRAENKNISDRFDSTVKISARSTKPVSGGKAAQITVVPAKPSVNNNLFWYFLIFVFSSVTFYNLYQYTVRTTEMSMAKSYTASVPPLTLGRNKLSSLPPATAPVLPAPPQPKKGEIILTGIVVMDDKNFALINNKFYEVGETVEEAQITKITADSIDILQKGKARTIKVLRPD